MDRRLRTVLAILVVMLGLGALLIAATGEHSPPSHPELNVHSGLLVTTRTEFQVCIESTMDRTVIEPALHGAMAEVRRHPVWAKAYRDARYDPETVLTWGCPGARLPERLERVTVAGPGVTGNPSPFRVWIYVLDGKTSDRVLGSGRSLGMGTAELMKNEQGLFPVSTALLVRDTELGTISGHLGEAAGLPRE